jgi:hypothetical protein
MFDFLKGKAITLVTDELDSCFSYILENRRTSGDEVNQVLNTIRHFIEEIVKGNLTEQQAQKHFMQMKTDIARKKGLSNHRDADYAKVYIVNAFFTCVASNKLKESKKIGVKIMDYCVQNCTAQVKSLAMEMRDEYTKIFRQ